MRISSHGHSWDCPSNEIDRLSGLLVRGEIETAVQQFKALEVRPRSKTARSKDWKQLIKYAELQLQKHKAKAYQLECLIRQFKAQRASNQPSPIEVAEFAGMVRVGSEIIAPLRQSENTNARA